MKLLKDYQERLVRLTDERLAHILNILRWQISRQRWQRRLLAPRWSSSLKASLLLS